MLTKFESGKWFRVIFLCIIFTIVAGVFLVTDSIGVSKVSAAGSSYYVSTTGSDTNPGTLASPYLTIQKCATVAVAGDTCNIRAGTYRETVTPNSGSAGNPIIFQNYNGETVYVSGSDPVFSTWTASPGRPGVYQTQVTMSLGSQNAVFYNGSMMMLARWPKVTSVMNKSSAITLRANDTPTTIYDANIPNLNWVGAKLWVYTEWLSWTSPISAFNNSTHTITFQDNGVDQWTHVAGYSSFGTSRTYYIYNTLQAVTQANDWFYDSATSTLYFYAPGGGVPGTLTEIRKRTSAFNIDNRSYINFYGLKIVGGATISTVNTTINSTGITLNASSNNIIMNGLTFGNYAFDADDLSGYYSQYNSGIVLQGNNIEIRNSEIYGSSGYGIFIQGDNTKIMNNYIHDIGYGGSFAEGLHINGHAAHIAHNSITTTGGSSLSGNNLYGALIEYNDFGWAGMISLDNGTTHWSQNDYQNTEIRYNWFHDGQDGAAHIYLDDFTSNMIVHDNSIYNVVGDAVRFNLPASNNMFYNNQIQGGNLHDDFGFVFVDDLYKLQIFNNVIQGPQYLKSPSNAEIYNNTTTGYSKIMTGSPGANLATPPSDPPMTFTYPATRNLVKNASFEGMNDKQHVPNDLQYWTKTYAMTAVGVIPAVGADIINNATGITRGGWGSVQLGGGVDGIQQVVSGLSPNTNYEFGGWARVDTGETANLGVSGYTSQIVTATASGWQKVLLPFTTGPSTTSVTIFLTKTSSGSNHIWGDDFSLVYTTIVNDTSPSINYAAGFANYSSARGFGDISDDVHYATTNGDYATYSFTGTGVDYIGEKNIDLGNVNVYIDGTFMATVNCYNATRLAQQTLYSKTGLAAGSHWITVNKIDGTDATIDAFRMYP